MGRRGKEEEGRGEEVAQEPVFVALAVDNYVILGQ